MQIEFGHTVGTTTGGVLEVPDAAEDTEANWRSCMTLRDQDVDAEIHSALEALLPLILAALPADFKHEAAAQEVPAAVLDSLSLEERRSVPYKTYLVETTEDAPVAKAMPAAYVSHSP